MEEWYQDAVSNFELYVNSFSGLTPDQQRNFSIKKDHTLRVAANTSQLAGELELPDDEVRAAALAAIFHDIGRFNQIAEFSTLDDSVSADHAELSVALVKEKNYLKAENEALQDVIYNAILHHNKFELPRNLKGSSLTVAKLLRDADKLDILRVLTDYYTAKNQPANHMLTWDLPQSPKVSPGVEKEIMAGKLVTRKEVKSETDVKIMQLSWIYDINFKPAVELILRNRYLDKIYNSPPRMTRYSIFTGKLKFTPKIKCLDNADNHRRAYNQAQSTGRHYTRSGGGRCCFTNRNWNCQCICPGCHSRNYDPGELG